MKSIFAKKRLQAILGIGIFVLVIGAISKKVDIYPTQGFTSVI